MMRIILIFISLCWVVQFNAQIAPVRITVEGYVYDSKSVNERIPDVKLFGSSSPSAEGRTTSKGSFKYSLPSKGNDTLFFSHIGFDSTYAVITEKQKNKSIKKGKPIFLKIAMNYSEFETFTVVANKVDTVYGSLIHSVEDFIITQEGDLLLLAYEKTLKKGAKIVLTDGNHEDLTEATIPGNAIRLFKDYAGISYVICEEGIYAIEVVQNQIRFESIAETDFYDFYHRVIDTIGSNYYYSTFNELYPAVSFVVTDKNDTTHQELVEIQDDFMMELYRAQYKYVSGRDKLWAYRKEQATGIDKEIWIGASSFTQDILYKPVYAPLFIIRDTVHIFDQYKQQLFKFNSDHQLVDSVPLNFAQENLKEKWEQPLIHDKVLDQVHGLYNKGGFYYIKSIDCQDGKIKKELKLNNRFVERIQIFNGKVYYIYRPYESLQKKFIYSEDLPE